MVLRSLFEEQIEAANTELEEAAARSAESNPEARTYFPPQRVGPHEYLSLVQRAKKALNIPVIASLNCCSPGSWTGYARQIADAGADALEVNVYAVEADPSLSGAEVEQRYVEAVAGHQGGREDPGGGEALALLHLARQRGGPAAADRRGRRGALQPLPPARHLAGADGARPAS